MATLLSLPIPIIEEIAILASGLRDVAALSQTCSELRHIIYKADDQRLWRALYLDRYDDPRLTYALMGQQDRQIDWQEMLKTRTRARFAIAKSQQLCDPVTDKPLNRELKQLIDALREARPGPGQSLNVALVAEAALAQPALKAPDRPGKTATFEGEVTSHIGRRRRPGHRDEAEKPLAPSVVQRDEFDQLLAQLSIYFGTRRSTISKQDRAGARALVYMLELWEQRNWGPFSGNKVDWKMCEALLVGCYNAMDLYNSVTVGAPTTARPPCTLENARPYTAPGWDDFSVENDWAGITGVWRRCISFLDWQLLFGFQRALERGDVAPVDFFLRFQDYEATHCHVWRMSLTGATPNPREPNFPDLQFKGEMIETGVYMHTPAVRGTVSMVNGEVQWNTITRFDGHDAYCSNAVSVGGIRSAFGVLGLWSGYHHHEGDPAGPYYMWKVNPDIDSLESMSSQ